jgi:23S rRNA pseudouridine1911/1915/1917 synthase
VRITENMNIENLIIFEDEDFIAVNKPSGVLVIPDRFDKAKENLYDSLNEKYGKIWIIHRLDRDTSGIVVFAKNPEAHRDLSMKWEAGEVSKTYYALVSGGVPDDHGSINKPIAPLKKKKGVMVVDKKNGKKSVTNYRVMERFKGFTLVEAMPKTGRTHQIRVHLAYIGHPIAGDVLYNRKEAMGGPKSQVPGPRSQGKSKAVNRQPTTDDRIDIPRLFLHAGKLSFCHYRKNETIDLEAPMPEDMNSAIMKLRLKGLVGS